MKITILDRPPDLDWLFETHLQPYSDLRSRAKIAIVHGNEDAPERVLLHDVDHDAVPPFATFEQNEVGNLARTDAALDHEYAFDVKLFAAIRIKAKNEAHARAALHEALNGVDANLGEILGQTIVCEVSMDGEPDLYEVDGESDHAHKAASEQNDNAAAWERYCEYRDQCKKNGVKETSYATWREVSPGAKPKTATQRYDESGTLGQRLPTAKQREGMLVRYGHGCTALAVLSSPHAGGWHGEQCMGGFTFFSGDIHEATPLDREIWNECAKWRKP